MEFPDLGKHCSEKTCKQLDFLPVKCDMCKQDFCKDHFTYAAHKCPCAFQKDVQVPVCPLCNIPIPVKKGQVPDVVVGDHMDRDCGYHPGKKKEKSLCSLRFLHTGAQKRAARRKRCCRWCVPSVTATSVSSTDTLWTTAADTGAAPPSKPGEKRLSCDGTVGSGATLIDGNRIKLNAEV
uniref:Zinc finger AN1-type containing 2A n=1 Tax=Aotus nancymaae TaxID=37293 RepID=A0A2K5CXX2_AOTNA